MRIISPRILVDRRTSRLSIQFAGEIRFFSDIRFDIDISRINEVVHGKRGIRADAALRLGAYFATSAEFWINLQSRYDLKPVRASLGPILAKTIRPLERQDNRPV